MSGMQCSDRRSRSSIDDDQLAAHVLVSTAAEDVALEWEAPRLVRDDADACRLSRFDVRADAELAKLEPVVAIERGDLEDDRHALLDGDLVGTVLELLCRHADQLFLSGARRSWREHHERRRYERDHNDRGDGCARHAHTLTTDH